MAPNNPQVVGDSPMLAMCLPAWEGAMLGCFHFEVKVRLLAGKFFPPESVTTEIGPKDGLLALLFKRLSFTDEEAAFLPKCNTLRNKLIHCEPDAVRRLVQELDPDFRPPDVVQQVRIPDDMRTGEGILELLNTGKTAVAVSTTSSRSEGFLGWMLQAAGDGTFDRARRVFIHGMQIIDSKLDQK